MTGASDRFSVSLALHLRPCREDDLARLEWFGMFADHRGIIRSVFDAQATGDTAMLLAATPDFPIAQVWLDFARIADEGGAYLWALRVLPPFRRLGIARRLVEYAETVAARRGVRFIELEVETDDRAVREMYERLDFTAIGRRHRTWTYTTPDSRLVSTPQDLIALRKGLVPTRPPRRRERAPHRRERRSSFAGP